MRGRRWTVRKWLRDPLPEIPEIPQMPPMGSQGSGPEHRGPLPEIPEIPEITARHGSARTKPRIVPGISSISGISGISGISDEGNKPDDDIQQEAAAPVPASATGRGRKGDTDPCVVPRRKTGRS